MSTALERIALRHGRDVPVGQLVSLYSAVGWTVYSSKPSRLSAAVSNSSFVVTAWVDERLVGIVRVVSDDVTVALIRDLLVAPEVARIGLRARLLQEVLERYAHVREKVMVVDAHDDVGRVYQAAGFRNTRVLRKMPLDAWVRYEGISLR